MDASRNVHQAPADSLNLPLKFNLQTLIQSRICAKPRAGKGPHQSTPPGCRVLVIEKDFSA